MNFNYKALPDNTVLSLIAPTASGKTDLACQLYETGRFCLISVDSALIYQDMDIGTAKPTASELAKYPHELINIIKPTETYNVATFVADVQRLIKSAHAQGKIPLLVGGTMMYYMALFDGLSAVPETNPMIRQQVAVWASEQGVADLYAYLQTHDPKICERLKVSDTQRITRAVEVHLQTGTPMSVWQTTPKFAPCQNPDEYWLGLSVEPERAWLHERIARRLDVMWEQGLVDEVVALMTKYPTLTPEMPSMRCVGYRQVLEFLAIIEHDVMKNTPAWERFCEEIWQNPPDFGYLAKKGQKNCKNLVDLACQDMKNRALYATRQLAKRQATWQRQLVRLNTPTIMNTNNDKDTKIDTTQRSFSQLNTQPVIVSFDSIKQVERQLLF